MLDWLSGWSDVMATRINSRLSDLYERDVYAWSKEQAELLRAGRFTELDLEHIIEEIEDVGAACIVRSAHGCGPSWSIS